MVDADHFNSGTSRVAHRLRSSTPPLVSSQSSCRASKLPCEVSVPSRRHTKLDSAPTDADVTGTKHGRVSAVKCNGELVLELCFSRRLVWSSFGSLFCALGAMRAEQLLLAMTSALVFVCSLNYWRHPLRRSWRRFVDIAAALIALLTHMHAAVASRYFIIYILTVLAGIGCYLRARRVGALDQDSSSAWHAAMHATGTAANLVMYQGLLV